MNTLKDLLTLLKQRAWHLFQLGEDAANEEEVIEGIKQGIVFRGAKLWILILAIFVASLGLNTNSAAVIIGAMLISPLMGPIIGMGLSAGIYDFDLLRRSWNNYIVATLFSVATATLYFLVTPIAEAQSELLARTSPTIYDVLIALCGGLAGIIALSSRSQRTGNVIPGVAIATALMPPLCTTGFGIATGNWAYAAGAFYLFIINTIFIAMSTFVGAVFIMKFHAKTFLNPQREKKVKRTIYLVAFITVLPALVLTFGMVRESYFEQRISNFIQAEMRFPSTRVLSHSHNFRDRTFSVVLIGSEVDSAKIHSLRGNLKFYGLEGVNMEVLQGTSSLNANTIHDMLTASRTSESKNEAIVSQMQTNISELEHQLQPYQEASTNARPLCNELKTLFPQVSSLSLARGFVASDRGDSTQVIALISLNVPLSSTDISRLTQWMEQRTKNENLHIVFEKAD